MLSRVQEATTWISSSPLRAYGLAVASSAFAFLIRLALDPTLGTQPAFSLFAFAVLLTAVLGGTRPGLVAMLLSVVLVEGYFYSSRATITVRDVIEVTLFVAVALGMLALNETMRGAQRLSAGALRAQESLTGQLRHEEATQRAILATIPDAMVVIDDKGIVQSFSTTAEALFGYEAREVIGQNVKMLMPQPFRREHDGYIARYLATGEARIIGRGRAVMALKKDGTTFPMELSVGEANVAGAKTFVGFVRDLTAKIESDRRMQSLQNELLHVSRLTAMGEMAATLAHELNQPLTAIANYAKAAHRTLASPNGSIDDVRTMLEKAAGQSIRAGQIIRRLRDFVEHREVTRAVEDPVKVVEESMGLGLVDVASSGLRVHSDFDRSAPAVRIDKIQIQQVLVNLMRNAVEAMQAVDYRELRIRVGRGEDNGAVISVCDTGPGLSEEVAARLFQPFVTTKKTGMGVGLSICQSIVEAHQGRIWVTQNQGAGVSFHVSLPAAADEQPAAS